MSETGTLFVCATPIGNLSDVTDRLRETLGAVDVIYAEDTRRTGLLLSRLGLEVKVRSLFVGNEVARTDELVQALVVGKNLALVSDAGTPTVSDPGAGAIRAAREIGASVTVIPGPSAVVAAVTLAGFGADRFAFEGFLPRKGRDRSDRIERLKGEDRPVVLFASPKRLAKDLEDLADILGPDREIAVARELTKLHEEVWVGSLGEAVAQWEEEAKGEVTLVLGPAPEAPLSLDEAVAMARSLVEGGSSNSRASREVSEETGVPRRSIYEALLRQDLS